MTQVALFGLKAAVSSAVCGAITGGAAWGTRYVSQIPTQDVIPAAIVGSVMTSVSVICDKFFKYIELKDTIWEFIYNNKNTFFPKPLNAYQNVKYIIPGFTIGLGLLVSTAVAPTVASLAGRNISYQAAALFSFINIFPTLIANSFTKK